MGKRKMLLKMFDSEWLSSINPPTAGVGKDVEKMCAVGRNAEW